MACLELTLTLPDPAAMAVAALPGAGLVLTPGGGAAMALTQEPQASMETRQEEQPSMALTPGAGAELTLGEVCSTGGGTLVVLAGSDGPFRTRGGGYFLLDPAKNPPE